MSWSQKLAERIAADIGATCDEEFINAVEMACISTPEYEADPEGCQQRLRGAQEELTDFNF